MKMIGNAEITTNKRITLPKKLLDALKAKEGDYIQFFLDDNGNIIVKSQEGL